MTGATSPATLQPDVPYALLYGEFQAQRDEILKHKWIESAKAGRDVGFEWALTDWILKHRSNWLKTRCVHSP